MRVLCNAERLNNVTKDKWYKLIQVYYETEYDEYLIEGDNGETIWHIACHFITEQQHRERILSELIR